MTTRSSAMSLALFVFPSVCVISIRFTIPAFNSALSNDIVSEFAIHAVALVVGLFAMYKYRFVEDHEYHRTRAIGRLSKTYKEEDRGLWERGENALEKLEAKAFTNFRGRRATDARQKMQSTIGSLNLEAPEVENSADGYSGFSLRIDGVEQSTQGDINAQTKGPKTGRFRTFLDAFVERTAKKRITISSSAPHENENFSNKSTKTAHSPNSHWVVPEDIGERSHPEVCHGCGTLNNPDANYCSSCGSFLSRAGNG
ncbi:MAG: zinc ribbon domain-containing protein [Candidatus Thalassarchaeaceae archaeon]|nr:zinc ribbon domain-containing protein [Candidatus Thalassarchaeaceae archaeon]